MPHTDSLTYRQIPHQFVFPFVLQDIHGVTLCDDTFPVSEYVTSCYISLPVVEGAVIASIEDYHPRVAMPFHYVAQVDIGRFELQRIRHGIGRHCRVAEVVSRQLVFLLYGFFHKVLAEPSALVILV